MNRFFQRVYGTVAVMVYAIAATCSFSACSDNDDAPPPPPPYAESRTVMVYMVAENSLASNAASDIREMLEGMNNDSLYAGDKLVIYLDDMDMPRIYVIDKTTKKSALSDLEPDMMYDEVNSSSSTQLATFIDYAKTHCHADSYGLVLWSHASGWLPSSYGGDQNRGEYSRRKTFGVDNGRNTSSNQGHQMNIDDMADALADVLNGETLDFLFFDACSMQNIEVAYELRKITKYLIASPAEIPALGANYKTMTKAMFRKDDYVERMLSAYDMEYRDSYGLVISAVNTCELKDFTAYMKEVVGAHKSEMLALNTSSMLNYLHYGEWRNDLPDFLDMQSIMLNVLSEDEFAEWKTEADKVFSCKHAGRWYSIYKRRNEIDDAQCCGVSMFIPFTKYASKSFNADYYKTSWAKAVWLMSE